MTNKVTRETLNDETLAELIAFRRSRVEYCQKEGLPYQKALHDLMMLALEELQERRKADSESVAEVLSNRPGNGTSIVDVSLPAGTQLYRHAQPASVVPVMPDFKKLARELVDNLVDCGGLDERVKEKYLEWAEKTCRAVMLQAGNAPVNGVTAGKPLTITLPDTSSKAFWSGSGKTEVFHPDTYRRWVKESIERNCVIARIDVKVK
ncbi:hypothetical protein RFD38_001768 [Klebsiella pneumoniae]